MRVVKAEGQEAVKSSYLSKTCLHSVTMQPILQVSGLSKTYASGQQALSGIDLTHPAAGDPSSRQARLGALIVVAQNEVYDAADRVRSVDS